MKRIAGWFKALKEWMETPSFYTKAAVFFIGFGLGSLFMGPIVAGIGALIIANGIYLLWITHRPLDRIKCIRFDLVAEDAQGPHTKPYGKLEIPGPLDREAFAEARRQYREQMHKYAMTPDDIRTLEKKIESDLYGGPDDKAPV